MRAIITAVVAAIEGAAVAFASMVLVAVAGLLLWIVVFGLAAEPSSVIAGIAATWLLGHLVPMSLEVTPETALMFDLPPERIEFVLSLAPLGILLLTVVLAARSGWRFAERGGAGAASAVGGFLGFGGAALVAAYFGDELVEWPIWLAAVVPATCYGATTLAVFLVRGARDEHTWWRFILRSAQRGIEWIGAPGAARLPARIGEIARIFGAALSLVIGLSGLGFAASVLLDYPEVIALTQGLQLDPIGSVLVFLLQLVLLPIAIIWGIAWVSGAGFAIGAGSSVTPFETLLGPLPALPIFGLVPQGWGDFGLLAPLLVVLIGVAVGLLFSRRREARRSGWTAVLIIPVLAAGLIGLAVAGLGALASGSLGPGRLEVVGVEPWTAGGLIAAEIGVGLLLGTAAGRIDLARMREVLPAAVSALPLVGSGERRSRLEHEGGIGDDAELDAALSDRDFIDELATVDLSEMRSENSRDRARTGGAPDAPGAGAGSTAGAEARGSAETDGPEELSTAGAGTEGTGTELVDAELVDAELVDTEEFARLDVVGTAWGLEHAAEATEPIESAARLERTEPVEGTEPVEPAASDKRTESDGAITAHEPAEGPAGDAEYSQQSQHLEGEEDEELTGQLDEEPLGEEAAAELLRAYSWDAQPAHDLAMTDARSTIPDDHQRPADTDTGADPGIAADDTNQPRRLGWRWGRRGR